MFYVCPGNYWRQDCLVSRQFRLLSQCSWVWKDPWSGPKTGTAIPITSKWKSISTRLLFLNQGQSWIDKPSPKHSRKLPPQRMRSSRRWLTGWTVIISSCISPCNSVRSPCSYKIALSPRKPTTVATLSFLTKFWPSNPNKLPVLKPPITSINTSHQSDFRP